jgi:cytochrome c556
MHGVNARAFYTSARLALLIAAAAAGSHCGGAAGEQVEYQPVATIDQVMDAIVIPSSQAVFDAVIYDNGVLTQAPKVDDDWFALQMHALAIAEAGNLLLMPPRARDTGDWPAMSRALTETAAKVAKAAAAKDIDGVLATGGEMYAACAACHRKYLPQE